LKAGRGERRSVLKRLGLGKEIPISNVGIFHMQPDRASERMHDYEMTARSLMYASA